MHHCQYLGFFVVVLFQFPKKAKLVRVPLATTRPTGGGWWAWLLPCF